MVDNPYQPTEADKEILKDDGHFRVLDMSSLGQSQPGRAAYFHNSLFGYHAAKLGRYNDVLDFHVYRNNMNVLNMLNTKYIIIEEEGQILPYTNREANGNAWFIKGFEIVDNANKEIRALDSLDTKEYALIQKSIFSTNGLKKNYSIDSTSIISLREFKPNYLKYETNNTSMGYAVFSEVYYQPGWISLLDGKEVPHHLVNYVLRGMEVPSGKHTIEFKFEPQVVKTGSTISLASSALLAILICAGLFYKIRRKQEVD